MRNFKRRPKNTGFTLIEFLAVVTLIGIGLYFILNNRNSAESGTNANALTQQALATYDGVKRAYRSGTYTGLTNATFISSRQYAPDTLVGGALQHAFKGSITFSAVNFGAGTNNGAQTVWAAVPGTACKPFVDSLEPQVQSITIGTTPVKSAALTYDPNLAITACDAANVNVTFVKVG